MPITFDQVYWYTNTCPLRKVTGPVIVEDTNCQHVRELAHDLVLGIMSNRLSVTSCMRVFAKRKLAARLGSSSKRSPATIVNLVNSSFWSADIWKTSKGVVRSDFIHSDQQNIIGPNDMEGSVDLVRFKRTGEDLSYLNLTWVRYALELPDPQERSMMMQYVNYNARAYHLITDTKPTQLDVFYPLLNHTESFIYNPECGYEVVAELISRDVYYGIPSPLCNRCEGCIMTWPE